MKIKLQKLRCSLATIPMLFMLGCSAGSTTESTPVVGFQGGDFGPIAPNLYDQLLANKTTESASAGSLKVQGGGAAVNVAAATGVVALVFPPGAVVLGAISIISSLVGADQVAAQINQINNELNYQESQIQNIYTLLNNTYNQIYSVTKLYEQNTLEANYNNWFNNIFAPSLFYGYGTSTSTIIGLNSQNVTNPWYQAYMNIVMNSNPSISDMIAPNDTIVNLLQNVAYDSASMSSLNSGTRANAANFLDVINAASLSVTSTSNSNTVLTVGRVSLNNSNSNNATVQLLLAAESALQVVLPKAGTLAGNNYMLTVESYNQLVNSVYLSNLSVLQTLYTVEATNNYLNYLNFVASSESNVTLSQICPLEANGGTTNIYNTINFYAGNATNCSGQAATVFYPNGYSISTVNNSAYQALTAQNAESAFVYAQQQLTNLYARRINTLYQQTMKFIYSDHGYPSQLENLLPNQTALSSEMSTVISATPQVKFMNNPIENYSLLGGNWINTSNIYQYPITNIDTTTLSIESNINLQLQTNPKLYPTLPAINSNNYPTIYQNIQTGYYDGESIAVYNATLSATEPFYFNESCVVSNGVYYWASGNKLICMTWSIADNYSVNYNTKQNSFNFQLSNGDIPNPGWLPTPVIDSDVLAGGGFNVAYSDQNYHVYYNSGSIVNSNAFSLVNGNGHFSVTGDSLYDGGIYNSGSSYHTAAMQVVLPNNFNFPFYIVAIGAAGEATVSTSLQLVCPAANVTSDLTSDYQNMLIPSLVSCAASGNNGNSGNSILSFTLSDGNSYQLQLNGGGGSGMHQKAYLELSN